MVMKIPLPWLYSIEPAKPSRDPYLDRIAQLEFELTVKEAYIQALEASLKSATNMIDKANKAITEHLERNA